MARLTVHKWADFQHYKDRSPPWIKLHKALLDNYEYQRLPIASRALAPMLWLLASESADGSIDCDIGHLAFRLRQPEQDIRDGLEPLIRLGFLISASDVLATCLQDACLETEGEREGEPRINALAPKKPSKPKTKKTQLPNDFCISERVARWAEEKGFANLEAHFEHFVSKAKAKNYTYADWDEGLMGAIRDNWAKVPVSSGTTSNFLERVGYG